jgi:hypothetical protein
MSEPLTIYECPKCGAQHLDRYWGRTPNCPHRGDEFREVRVFREEDVRPLWEAAQDAKDMLAMPAPKYETAVDAFPAPEEWKEAPG